MQRDPKSGEAAARFGRLAWQRRAAVEAEGLLERAVAGGGHPSARFDLGLVRQDMRKFGSAAQVYRRVLEMSPDAPEAAVNLGVVLQETGDLDEAMAAYSLAYGLSSSTFGVIAMALTSAPRGRLWRDEKALRRSLAGGAVPAWRETACGRRRALTGHRRPSAHRMPVAFRRTLRIRAASQPAEPQSTARPEFLS
ncbi:tetratricopeptide repeat protein [Mesorhizobium caraganae]|uniref:Tetratricopeptide repeat protein n=1 Tax=Mesorhizobium caraganae TaxID=483206 RepID=A0ABV1Z9P5_9HYPH